MAATADAPPRPHGPAPRPSVAAHSLRRNAAWMGFGQATTWTLTALTLALLPRYFGAENLGRIGVAVAFAQLAMTVAGLGMATLITREVARGADRAAELLATALWLHVVLGIGGGAVAVATGMALGYEPLTWMAITVMAVTVPFDLVSLLGFGTLQGLEIMRYHAVWDVAGKFVHLVGLGAVVAFDLGLVAYLGVSFVAAVVPAVAAYRLMRRFVPFRLNGFSLRRAAWIVREAVPIGAVNVVLMVYLAIDVILLSRLADESASGIYAAPMRIFGTMLFAPTIIATVLFPRMSAVALRDREALRRLCDGALRIVLGVTVLAALGATTVGRQVVVDVFGAEFTRSGAVLAVMAIALVPTSLNMVAHRVLVALNRQAMWTWVMLGALAVKIGLDVALIPLFDRVAGNPALGAAVALAVAETGIVVVALRSLPAGVLSGGLGAHAVRLGLVAGASAVVGLLLEPRGFLVAGFATLAVFVALALATRTYTLAEVRSAIRLAAGRETMAAAADSIAAPLPSSLAVEAIVWDPARMKVNRPASPHRGLHLVDVAAPPPTSTVNGPVCRARRMSP